MEEPGRFVFDAQVSAELQRRDPRLGLANQIEGQEQGGQRQLGRLHDRAGREGGLKAAVAALIGLVPPAVDEAMLLAISARATEPIRPLSLLQNSLKLHLAAVEPLELK